MLREGIKEEPRKTIDIFHSGLNLEIRDRFKFLPFDDFNDLIHFNVRIELLEMDEAHLYLALACLM